MADESCGVASCAAELHEGVEPCGVAGSLRKRKVATPRSNSRGAETPIVVIEPSHGLSLVDFRAMWQYRELLFFLVWRDVKVRYKQTLLGVLWVVLQPLASMGVFTLLFGVLLDAPSGEAPYPLFVLAGLLPWTYFATVLTRSSNSLVNNANLITKTYFPRVAIPVSSALAGLLDLVMSLVVFGVLMLAYHTVPTVAILLLPVIVLHMVITALGFGLWLSALNVRYRDVGYLVPFVVQIWMYVTPVAYASTLIPERYRFLLSLNPMTAVVEAFRWALLGRGVLSTTLSPQLVALSIGVSVAVFVGGLVFFRTTERTLADEV